MCSRRMVTVRAPLCKKVVTNGSNVCVRDVATKPPEEKTVTLYHARGPELRPTRSRQLLRSFDVFSETVAGLP